MGQNQSNDVMVAFDLRHVTALLHRSTAKRTHRGRSLLSTIAFFDGLQRQ